MKSKICAFLAVFVLVCSLPHAEARKATRRANRAVVCCCCGTCANQETPKEKPYVSKYVPVVPEREPLSNTAVEMRERLRHGFPTDLEMMKPWLQWR